MNKGCCCNGSSEKMSSMINMMMSHEKFDCMEKCMEMMQRFSKNHTERADSSQSKCTCFASEKP
ncbi:MAG: hypothetical protein H6Q72_1074 [Firmicutes bacterium]|nr:hypothetical protein [Bacillota bacterium]